MLLTEAVQLIALGACGGMATSLLMGCLYQFSFFAIGAALAPAWKAASRPPAEVMHTDV